MAAAAVGGAFLSAFIEVVLDRLASPQCVRFITGNTLNDDLLQRLKSTLNDAEAVLDDAEQKQIKNSKVNVWLDDLKDALYIADDILDQISTKVATTQKNKEVSTASSSFLYRYLESTLTMLPNMSERDMVRKLEDIVARLDIILKRKDKLNLQHIATHHHSSWRTPSTSLDHGSNIFGRNQDIEAILNLLLDDGGDDDSDKISVIPIVGMGGVGKTTLVQSVYNHDDTIKHKFNVQAWVCVSDDFDVLKVTKAIAEEVRSACNTNNLNILQRDLKDKLTGKKFLIVLDDVWTQDYDNWNSLIKPLRCGAKGSKILVTTRIQNVVTMVQTFQGYYSLEQLSDEDCWSVFAKHACLSQEKSTQNMDLEKIGKEIVRKCKGLPLAAQSLGGLLRLKRDIRDWNNILNSNIWEIDENASKIIPALRISYHYLPSYLKRCFVYCSLFPKDYEFDEDNLILLWMAEDLLQPPKNGKTLEEVGYEYFNELVSRSFFQRFESGNRSQRFVMHDLVHDLATLIGAKFYFRTEELGKQTKIDSKTRHLSFNNLSDPMTNNFEIFDRAKHLRTFLTINFRYTPFNNENASRIILSNLKCLRVLSFKKFHDLNALHDSIGELIHLRYLDLSSTNIKTLPESLCNLHNLQTFKLYYCYELTKLPNGMQKLVNLHYLDIRSTPKLEDMPREMSKLNHLQHLSCFVVGKHQEKGIKELGTLSNLHGSLSISKLENVSNNFEASQAKIMDKKYLEKLSFEWSDNAKDHFTNSQSEMDIFDKLQPAKNIKKVSICGYRGTRLPEWVGDPSYQNLTKLSLYGCHNCYILPPIGQLGSLKKLKICGMSMLETIGSEYGSSFSGILFPSLECLQFADMPCWKVWHHPHESNAYFLVLKSLMIHGCPLLSGDLPSHLPALETIEIEECDKLVVSLPRALAIRKIEIRKNNKAVLRELPLSLEEIEIHGKELTESFFEVIAITLPISLKIVKIENCSSMLSFPGDCLPTLLNSLSIIKCKNIDFPKQKQQQESLQSLYIRSSCDSLTTLPLETFPNLSSLIVQCKNLEFLSASKVLQNLNEILISKCPKLVSFARDGLFAPNLRSLSVYRCVNLKSLTCHANTLLPKLEWVRIYDCPEMETFSEGGMSPSLRYLDIQNCEKLMRGIFLSLMDMLTCLTIGRCDGVESFPNNGFALLHPSLTSLTLNNMPSLHTLECTELLHLTSLQKLAIEYCSKLENMAGERLPATLTEFQIYKCPLLEERCRMKHPQIWPKISHIQSIVFDKMFL